MWTIELFPTFPYIEKDGERERAKVVVVLVLWQDVHVAYRIKYSSCSILKNAEHELGLNMFF